MEFLGFVSVIGSGYKLVRFNAKNPDEAADKLTDWIEENNISSSEVGIMPMSDVINID